MTFFSISFLRFRMCGYYYDAVLWAVANGITSGTSNNQFSPDMAVSRAQVVTFLYQELA